MVEWGRLLSGYWGEILSRRFESCPPRHNKTRPKGRVFAYAFSRWSRQGGWKLFETQLHPQMGFFESQPFVEPVRIFSGLVGG